MARGPSRGVTLIELLVVMSILAILLTLAGPPISAGIDNILLKSTSQKALAALKNAQIFARGRGEQVFVTYTPGRLNFLRGKETYRTLELPSTVRIAATDASQPFLF